MAPRQRITGNVITEHTVILYGKEITTHVSVQPNRGALAMEVGSYKNIVLPLLACSIIFFISIYGGKAYTIHPLSEGMFLLGNFQVNIVAPIVYILFCTIWGPRMMKDREPVRLKSIIQFYNIFQVILCCYMFYEFSMAGWLTRYSFRCEPSTYATEANDVRMANVGYVYYLSKYLDLLDTVFFVLTKKWEHISVLHLVHHSTMVANMSAAAYYMPLSHTTFGWFINSFIHIVMYGYYFLASLGPAVRPYLWWKKYLTMLQMIQLASVTVHVCQVFFNGCDVAYFFLSLPLFSSVLYFLLFLDFYIQTYKKRA